MPQRSDPIYWMTANDIEKSAKAEFAPGIADESDYGSPSMLTAGEMVPWVVQKHMARRSGPHFDIRLGRDKMLSFATKKELPAPGQKITVFPQRLHSEAYAKFQGTIPLGTYGAGKVYRSDYGKVLILAADPDKIKFVVAHREHPEEFTLVRMAKPGKGRKPAWLMLNTTPVKAIEHKKVHYQIIDADKIDKLFDPAYVMSAKIDGAAGFVQLMKDKVHVLSYRARGDTGEPIVHTHRLGLGGKRFKIPKHLQNTVMRAEIYGERRGKTIPAHELGGILNATVEHSLEKQREQDVALRLALLRPQVFGNTPWQQMPWDEQQTVLSDVQRVLGPEMFTIPPQAETEAQKRKMWEDVVSGRNPLTREGVVGIPRAGGIPLKVKPRPEAKVYITDIVPGEGRLRGKAAGGFWYAVEPRGKPVGKVGTGFSDEDRVKMWREPRAYVGRVARIQAQDQFASGAYRAPSFVALHEDYPLAKAATLDVINRLRALGQRQVHGAKSAAVLKSSQSAVPATGFTPQQLRNARVIFAEAPVEGMQLVYDTAMNRLTTPIGRQAYGLSPKSTLSHVLYQTKPSKQFSCIDDPSNTMWGVSGALAAANPSDHVKIDKAFGAGTATRWEAAKRYAAGLLPVKDKRVFAYHDSSVRSDPFTNRWWRFSPQPKVVLPGGKSFTPYYMEPAARGIKSQSWNPGVSKSAAIRSLPSTLAHSTWPWFVGGYAGDYALSTLTGKAFANQLRRSPKIYKPTLPRIFTETGLEPDFPTLAIPGYGNASYVTPRGAEAFADRMLKMELIDDALRTRMRQKGVIVYDPDFMQSGVLAHEAGHANIGNRPWYSPSKAIQGPVRTAGSFLNSMSSLPAAIVGVQTGKPWLGALTGLTAAAATSLPSWINELQASNLARRYLDTVASGKDPEAQKKLLSRAYMSYVIPGLLLPALVGAGSGWVSKNWDRRT